MAPRNVFDNREAAKAYLDKVGSKYEIVVWMDRETKSLRWSVVGKPRISKRRIKCP